MKDEEAAKRVTTFLKNTPDSFLRVFFTSLLRAHRSDCNCEELTGEKCVFCRTYIKVIKS